MRPHSHGDDVEATLVALERVSMKTRFLSALGAGVLLFASLNPAYAAQLIGLGDLAGGSFISLVRGISADGSVVVGVSSTASGTEAFRWT